MSFDKKSWIKNAIRRASYKFPPRYTTKTLARVERNKYKCGICGELKTNKEVQLDHKEPVINPETGFVDWNDFVERMFPDLDGWQLLCSECHEAKSIAENAIRRQKKMST